MASILLILSQNEPGLEAETTPKHRLLGVIQYPLYPAQIRINLVSGDCQKIGTYFIKIKNIYKKDGFYIRKATVSQDDFDQLQNLIVSNDKRLKDFNPKLSWFKGMLPAPDWHGMVVIKWSDMVRAFGLPSPDMLSNVPEKDKETYEILYKINRSVSGISYKMSSDGSKEEVVNGANKAVIAYKKEYKHHREISLPKGRKWW